MPGSIEIHCLGGFVAAVYYALPRPTNDLDYVEVVPFEAATALQEIAGMGSLLARRYGLYFQHVGVASLPESYTDRLTELFPRTFQHLHLFGLDPHDLALSKLTRNTPIDREDVTQLAKAVPLNAEILRRRYHEELRPIIIGDPERHDRTLEMWIEAYFHS